MKMLLASFAAVLVLLLTACSQSGPASAVPSAGAVAATQVRHVNVAEARKLALEQNVPVLDLRTPEEFKVAHIAGARMIDFMAADFAARLGELDRNQTYLIHCASGRRSTKSLEQFRQLGFKEVIHLDGGFNAWMAANLPAEK